MNRFSTTSEFILAGRLPEGYPYEHPVEGVQKVPVLPKVGLADVPEILVPFNSPKRLERPSNTGVHFFDHGKNGPKYMTALTQPLRWIYKFQHLKCVIAPDSLMLDGMPPWQRARNTVLTRASAAVWQDHGIKIIPSLRWCDETDYELVSSGISRGSVFAVSADSEYEDPKRTHEFEKGLKAIIKIIEPEGVMILVRCRRTF